MKLYYEIRPGLLDLPSVISVTHRKENRKIVVHFPSEHSIVFFFVTGFKTPRREIFLPALYVIQYAGFRAIFFSL